MVDQVLSLGHIKKLRYHYSQRTCILKRCMTKNEKYEINLNRTTCLLFGFQIDNINQTLRLIKMKYNNSCTYREPFMYFCVTCSFGPSRRGWNDIQKAETMLQVIMNARCEISGCCLLSFCQNERFLSFLSLYIFEESEFIFQFLYGKMDNYVLFNIIVHFIIEKLKNKHTLLKNIQTEKAEEPLILTKRDEKKTRYFAP